MKTVIKQVLDLDARAQQKLQEAYRRREEEMARVDAEASQKREELSAHCEARIQKIYEQEKAICDEQLAQAAKEEEAARAQLKKRFEDSAEGWIEGIVKAIVG